MKVTTIDLEGPPDPTRFVREGGFLLQRGSQFVAGIGSALTLEITLADPSSVSRATEVLVSLDSKELPPLAVGALPFDPQEVGRLVVPTLAVRCIDDRWYALVCEDGLADDERGRHSVLLEPTGRDPDLAWTAAPSNTVGPTEFVITPELPAEEWLESVRLTRESLSERCRKVVIGRTIRVRSDRPFSAPDVAARLRALAPGCTLYAVDGFVGATPELLLERDGRLVRTMPLAGTAPSAKDFGEDPTAAALLGSAKDREEHRITIEAVHQRLLHFCSWVDEQVEPTVTKAGPALHLGTLLSGRLSDPPATALQILSSLHPTPAVCGDPRQEAAAIIRRVERSARGPFGGPVGWVDAEGDGSWWVGIRGAVLRDREAIVWAGVGIVRASDPWSELEETRLKMRPVISALVRP
ncbi:MAG: isochorismate synthase [Acidimicrobiales bacterium]|nr:MAG: isochorismate synthase [Acidimicrobiales bacterium]